MNNSKTNQIGCLILACGNTLREDDGVGPFLAEWAEETWRGDARVRVLCDHQWTPEMVEEVSQAETVVFVDCAIDSEPGAVRIKSVEPAGPDSKIGTHHLEAGQLLSLSQQLYGVMPRSSLLLTVGARSVGLREGLSEAMTAALPEAQRLLAESVQRLLHSAESFNADQRA